MHSSGLRQALVSEPECAGVCSMLVWICKEKKAVALSQLLHFLRAAQLLAYLQTASGVFPGSLGV